jgi:hypothetical protein
MASKSIQILVNEISGLGRYGAVEQSPGISPMKLLSRKKIGVTQSPNGESFISFRMATGAG